MKYTMKDNDSTILASIVRVKVAEKILIRILNWMTEQSVKTEKGDGRLDDGLIWPTYISVTNRWWIGAWCRGSYPSLPVQLNGMNLTPFYKTHIDIILIIHSLPPLLPFFPEPHQGVSIRQPPLIILKSLLPSLFTEDAVTDLPDCAPWPNHPKVRTHTVIYF